MTQDWFPPLAAQGFSADGRSFGRPAAELLAARDATILVPLSDLGLIRASGEEAAGFLHNLLTNDIKGLGVDGARLAGMCTAKGRLLALFMVWREGDDFLLMLPRDILPAMLKKLTMYVLRAKVRLADATPERALLGISCAAVPPAPTFAPLAGLPVHGAGDFAGGRAIRLDPGRWLLALDPAAATAGWPAWAAAACPAGLDAWRWREIAAGQPRVVAATQEAFVPQMLNLELPAVAGVSFTKGCYPGQEIVARTQYLGKIKRRTFRARLAEDLAPGTHLFAPATGDQSCGALVSVAPSPDGGFECLACVQIGAVEGGEVRAGTPDGARLDFLALPYEVD